MKDLNNKTNILKRRDFLFDVWSGGACGGVVVGGLGLLTLEWLQPWINNNLQTLFLNNVCTTFLIYFYLDSKTD